MEAASNPPAAQPSTAGRTIGYGLLAAAVGALTATLTTVVGFFVLTPINSDISSRSFQDALVFLGVPHLLVCGTPACLVGGVVAILPGLLLARLRNRGAALLTVLAASFVVGVVAGVAVQWGMVLLYNYLLPCGAAGPIGGC